MVLIVQEFCACVLVVEAVIFFPGCHACKPATVVHTLALGVCSETSK
jgi:hypothetical protein